MSLPPPPPPRPPRQPTSLPQPPGSQRTSCFRHPGREAGRRCTRCGRWACSECLVRADIGSQCVECARAGRPPARTRARDWNARQPVLVTYTLMAINIGVYVWMALRDPANLNPRGDITAEQADLALAERVIVQTTGGFQIIDVTEQWYRLVSSGFLHFGLLHIAFNMLLLYQLGNLLEPAIGRIRFTLVYFAALLGGSAVALAIQPNALHGGASGAVFGLLGAAAVMMYQRGVNPLSTGVGTVIVLNLFITFTLPGISIGGHLGGLAAGAAAGWFATAPRHRGIPTWATYAAPAAVAVIAVVVAYLAARGGG